MTNNAKLTIQYIIDLEGAYVNNPKDPGGETKYGISKRAFPNLDIKNLTEDDAFEIYYKKYYLPNASFLEKLPEALRKKFFALGVNAGFKQAFLCLQRALRNEVPTLAEDGVFGANSQKALNQVVDWSAILYAFNSETAAFYRLCAIKNGNTFLKGWLNRAYHK